MIAMIFDEIYSSVLNSSLKFLCCRKNFITMCFYSQDRMHTDIMYDIKFQVDGREGTVSYDIFGLPRMYMELPGWFKAPKMASVIAKAMHGCKYPIDYTYKSWKESQNELSESRFRAIIEDKPLEQHVKETGLLIDNSEVDKVVDELLSTDPPEMMDYVEGKIAALGVLIGKVKKHCNADPKVIRKVLEDKIKKNIEAYL